MELYAKGQLSYLILTCLQERDFYGLDIITEISNKSNGKINLKKPSVYSNLTRMEKQGYISAYLQSSDLGPNRKYYSLTEKGRGFYNDLKNYYESNNVDVFSDFEETDNLEKNNNIKENVVENKIENQAVEEIAQSDDFFDFSSLSNVNENEQDSPAIEEDTKVEVEKQEEVQFIKEDSDQTQEFLEIKEEIEQIQDISEVKEEKEEQSQEIVEDKKDDGVFISNENAEEYNKRLYDISKDINKIKRKRSFADDQIAMTATDPLYISNEKVKSSIEEFKSSILENKEKYQDNSKPNNFDYFKSKMTINKQENIVTDETKKAKEIKNDARFITERIDATQVEHARKVQPLRIKILQENNKDILPAPNRDKSIDPSHRDILNKLYSKTKDLSTENTREDSIYDYNDLKDYYASQNISFNIYQRNTENKKHNTNKLYFLISLITFILSATISTALYLVFNHFGLVNFNTDFMYILLPCLVILDIGFSFYNFKNYSSWIPSKIKPQWLIWLIFILLSIVVVGLNFAFGMATKPFELFINTLILPLALLLIILPIRYYIKKHILVKYWR